MDVYCRAFDNNKKYARNNLNIHIDVSFLFFVFWVFFVFLPFLGPLPRHMEVPRLEVQSEL